MFAATFLGIDSASQPHVLSAMSIIAVFLLAVTALALHHWQKSKNRDSERERIEIEADLKDKMIERGMSADEIAKVLSARSPVN